MFETVLYEKQTVQAAVGGSIAWVTLNRPQVLNAVNLAMRDDLWTIIEAVEADPDVGVVILEGAGDRAFSSGADLTEFGTAPSYVESRRARQDRDLWAKMLALPKPMIAAIHGFAYGAGCEMSLCCDLRVASEDAKFALPEIGLGYIPSAGGTQTLPRAIGPGNGLYMVLTGEPITARQALEFGLVEWVVPRQQLRARAEAIATAILERPAAAVRAAKQAVYRGLEMPLPEALALEARLGAVLSATGPTV